MIKTKWIYKAILVVGLAFTSAYLHINDAPAEASSWALLSVLCLIFIDGEE